MDRGRTPSPTGIPLSHPHQKGVPGWNAGRDQCGLDPEAVREWSWASCWVGMRDQGWVGSVAERLCGRAEEVDAFSDLPLLNSILSCLRHVP